MKSKICPPPHPLSKVGGKWPSVPQASVVCSLGVKADENWNINICNKKQYIYFIWTFELLPFFVNYKWAKQMLCLS